MSLSIYNTEFTSGSFIKGLSPAFAKSLSASSILRFERILDKDPVGYAYAIGGFFASDYKYWVDISTDTGSFFVFKGQVPEDAEYFNTKFQKALKESKLEDFFKREAVKSHLISLLDVGGDGISEVYAHLDPTTQDIDGILIDAGCFFFLHPEVAEGEVRLATTIKLNPMAKVPGSKFNKHTTPAAAEVGKGKMEVGKGKTESNELKSGYKDGYVSYIGRFYFPQTSEEEDAGLPAESFTLSKGEARELAEQVEESMEEGYPGVKVTVIPETKTVLVTYPKKLKPNEVKEEIGDVQGGFSDGFGENGYTLTHKGEEYTIFVD